MDFNGVALAVIRDLSGLTQSELSRLSGVSQGHISQLESGDKRPRPAVVRRLARALGVPAGALVPPGALDEVATPLEELVERTRRSDRPEPPPVVRQPM